VRVHRGKQQLAKEVDEEKSERRGSAEMMRLAAGCARRAWAQGGERAERPPVTAPSSLSPRVLALPAWMRAALP